MENVKMGSKITAVLRDILCGAAIGIAFIIPGFSGGTVAAILGIYERLVGAVSDFFKHFKSSVLTLLPIAAGMVLGVAALILPIRWGLEYFPLPTVSLFVGLAIGGIPPLRRRAGKADTKKTVLFFAAFLLAASLAFLPVMSRPADFLYHLDFGGYLLLFLVAFAASCALVVPGISGSMLLLVFGYYTPLVALITDLVLFGKAPLESILVLGVAAAGILLGFFLISSVMRYLLARYPQTTYAAVLGFILGSIPCIYVSAATNASPWTWVAAFVSLAVGFAISYAFVRYVERRKLL